ncbi:SRR1-like protein isoform X2 [Colius striatus]|uniref:SRR1-like protein isoform X2 n=1 Tax=Colius striatus TaxID=57412 RepID=UPI002B1D656A|nr:SRR1-like protein isoform X2 [Colius striatus]
MAERGWRAAGGRRRRGAEAAEGHDAVLRRLREARDDLLSSGFWEASAGAVRASVRASAEPPVRCVCYGLGRFGGCPAARCQLAFLLLLLDELRVPPGRCSLFDPAFSAREAAVLQRLGLRLLPDNELVTRIAVVYVPCFGHFQLADISPLLPFVSHVPELPPGLWLRLLPLCYSRLLSRILERDYSYIAKVLKGTEEVALPSHPRYLDTFNDTSIHWFPLQKLQGLAPEVWDCVEEPTYQHCEDLEIIRKDRAEGSAAAAAS